MILLNKEKSYAHLIPAFGISLAKMCDRALTLQGKLPLEALSIIGHYDSHPAADLIKNLDLKWLGPKRFPYLFDCKSQARVLGCQSQFLDDYVLPWIREAEGESEIPLWAIREFLECIR